MFIKFWPCIHIFWVLCDKMGLHNRPFCFILLILKKSNWLLSLEINYLHFSWNTIFTWKNNWQTSYSYSGLSIRQAFSWKWMKRACHFKEKKKKTLFLPVIKFKFSSNNKNFGILVTTSVNLTVSQYIKTFPNNSVMILKM